MNVTIRINGDKVVAPTSYLEEGKQFPTGIPCTFCTQEIILETTSLYSTEDKPNLFYFCNCSRVNLSANFGSSPF